MATYRNISLDFWSDPKIRDDFLKDEKYIYLYLLTNPDTNICGCYEISRRQMELDLDMKWDQIQKCLNHMCTDLGVIKRSEETREILVLKWGIHNWTKSEKLLNAVLQASESIKNEKFKSYVLKAVDAKMEGKPFPTYEDDTVSVQYHNPIETVSVPSQPQPRKTAESIIKEFGFSPAVENQVLLWVKYKTERRQSYKEIGLKSLLKQISKKVAEFGETAVIDVIELAMSNGWQGIVWDRIGQGRQNGQNSNLNAIDAWGA